MMVSHSVNGPRRCLSIIKEGPVQLIKTRCLCEVDSTLTGAESAVVSTSPGDCIVTEPDIQITETSGLLPDDGVACAGEG
jgi:hypothetical protein